MDIEEKKKAEAAEAEKAKKAKEEAEAEDKAKKAKDLTRDQLRKGLDGLTNFVNAGPDTRKVELLEKAKVSVLSDSEKVELQKALFGDAAPGPGAQIAASAEREPLAKSEKVELVAGVDELRKSVVSALTDFGKLTDARSVAQNEFNLMLAKSVLSVGTTMSHALDTIDRLEKSLAKWGEQPAGAPRFQQPAPNGGTPPAPPAAAAAASGRSGNRRYRSRSASDG